jgi:hypothetical protein
MKVRSICGMLQGCLRMITTALQQLTIFIAHPVVQVYSGERVVERCVLVTQAEVYWFHRSKPSPFIWSAVLLCLLMVRINCSVIGQLGFGLVFSRALKGAADRLVGCAHITPSRRMVLTR